MRQFVVLLAGLSLCACATVTRGTTDQWSITSTPPGAAVRTSTGFACEATPCSFKMPRKSAFDVTVSKTGYKDWTGKVEPKLAGSGGAGFLGNALVGGVIGAGVDVASGAMMDLTPNPMNVTLEQQGDAKVADNAAH